MDGHKHGALSDDVLEREIEAALGVDPSPEFLPRVRARIASERVHEGWMWSSPWRWAGVATTVVAITVVAVWTLREPAPAPRETQVLDMAAGNAAAASSRPASTESPAPIPVRAVRKVRRQGPPATIAPLHVVVSADEAVGLRQLVAAIATRQIKAVDIPTLDVESTPLPLPPLEEIVLEPIKLSPLAGLEGE